MKYYFLWFSITWILWSCTNFISPAKDSGEMPDLLDSSFVQWNKATIISLKSQLALAKDDESKFYQNRLESLNAYLNISNFNEVNRNSIRYNFLLELFSDTSIKIGEFYVVEANQKGEQVDIINYVIYADETTSDDLKRIDAYKYINNAWKKVEIRRLDLQIHSDLKRFLIKFPSGFNQDDIITTRFVNRSVMDSQYFLFGTLSSGNFISKVIDSVGINKK